ncbi:bifunctional precorrin-2 dehydrogenase/sirohydrochlorin ferrochelatase [Phycisphaeraceae bacterium D3-23]
MADSESQGISVMLDVTGWRVLIVGGGAVAARRAEALLKAGAEVAVVAPSFEERLDGLAVRRIEARYDPAQHALTHYRLVVIATDDPATNALVAAEWAELSNPPLCNRADAGDAGDLTFMATHRDGPLTLAVSTGGASASAAAAIRDDLAAKLDPCWPGVLIEARAARQEIQQQIQDPAKRSGLLGRLTDDAALAVYRAGGAEALRNHYRDIMRGSR